MNPSAQSNTSLSFCVHCAAQLPERAVSCPGCGKAPFGASRLDDDDAWFDAGKPSDDAANDQILEAMMAIAAAKPVAAPPRAVLAQAMPEPPEWGRMPPPVVAPLRDASMPARGDAWQRRALAGAGAVSVLAALTVLLLHADRLSLPPQTASVAAAVRPAVAVTPSPADDSLATGAVATAEPEPAPPMPPQVATPDRSEPEDARTIATALGLGERPPVPAPRALPEAATPAAVAAAPPGATVPAQRCGDALAALALCRKP